MPRFRRPSWHDREVARRRARGELPPVQDAEPPSAAWADGGFGSYCTTLSSSFQTMVNQPQWSDTLADMTVSLHAEAHGAFVRGQYAFPQTYALRALPPRVRVQRTFSTNGFVLDEDDARRYHYAVVEHEIRRQIGETRRVGSTGQGWVACTVQTEQTIDNLTVTVEAWPTSQDPSVDVWQGWVDQRGEVIASPGRDLTPEELEAREVGVREEAARAEVVRRRNEMIAQTRVQARAMKQRVAARAAEKLLRGVLDEEQNHTLTASRGFEVRGSNGGMYWIDWGYSGNVYSLNEQRQRTASMCAHIAATVPDCDHMLAQYLMLQSDESAFLRVANVSHYSVPRVNV